MNNRRLLLLSLDWVRPKDPPLSLGHASILSNLRKHKINTIDKSWAVNSPEFSPTSVVDFIMEHAHDKTDVALGAFVWNEKATQHICNALKINKFPGNIILGGPQVSYTGKDLETYYPQADIFIRGYGEDALAKLYTSPQNKPVLNGVHYRGEQDLAKRAEIEFEGLPSPYLEGTIKPQRFIRWETKRGCPFHCSFCQHRGSNPSKSSHNLPLSRVLQEAEWITNNPIIQDIAILDPTFNSNPKSIDRPSLQVLDKLIEGKYSGKLSLQCRAEAVTDQFIDTVIELNQTANVVLEFGLQTIHKEEWKLIHRPNNMDKISSVLLQTANHNIETEISLIFGLPMQTLSSFQSSVDFCKNMGVKTIHAFPLMLLRGTLLHSEKAKLGLVESSDVSLPEIDRIQGNGGISHVIESPSFSRDDWKRMAEVATELDCYNRKNKELRAVKRDEAGWPTLLMEGNNTTLS